MANSIRAAILPGDEGARSRGLIAAKKRRRHPPAEETGLPDIAAPALPARNGGERGDPRHAPPVDQARVVWRGREIEVSVVNVSAGGVMIETLDLRPAIGERVDLRIADCSPLRCTICWLKGCRIGLQFCHETAIDGPGEVQELIIRKLRGETIGTAPDRAPVARPRRYRLIWQATLHYQDERTPARIRNISPEGAMIECDWDFHVGTEVMLDLEEAGTLFARVRWGKGGQIGLQFNERFDLRVLAACKPVAARSVPHHPAPAASDKPRRIRFRRGRRLSVTQLAALFKGPRRN